MMKSRSLIVAICTASCFGLCFAASATAETFDKTVAPLIEDACIHCHDADTETDLNFEVLGNDLTDFDTFRQWEKVFDRVHSGEMPPKTESRPEAELLKTALASLKQDLHAENAAAQKKHGRVPRRRLTQLEYEHTIHDLLGIDGDFANLLPGEVDSGGFDTVGATQRVSSVHVQSYLQAADTALDTAIKLHGNPHQKFEFDWLKNQTLNAFHEKELSQGGNITKKLNNAVVLFSDVDYLLTSVSSGFNVRIPGKYRITSQVKAYRSDEPIVFKLIVKEPSGAARLIGAYDLMPGEKPIIHVETWLKPGDMFYLTLEVEGNPYGGILAVGGAKNYYGPGLAVKSTTVEGPLSETWPPTSTKQLLSGVKLARQRQQAEKSKYQIELSREPIEHVSEIVERIAPLAFRRPPHEDELEDFVALAQPVIEEGRDFVDVARVPLRSILTSPQFLFFDGQPGKLDNYALANRLSYFIWKSMPDEELFALAESGKLSQDDVLLSQVDRMLANKKSNRFIHDFHGQWLTLYQINATSPDENLYPDYDELLGNSLPKETELFFAEMIRQDLSLDNFVDADFTFVNRRLAEHYELPPVEGQDMRRVDLPADSPRGGILTQAAVLKSTANGTVTSPVTRGNFVLTNLLGTPPSPPPPNIGSIEPDTRGKTTIREILDSHRNIEACAQCHREIDPPGFALESFDPIGGFREKYRATTGRSKYAGKTYKEGLPVDASGETSDGDKFSGIDEFKTLLLKQRDQLAKNFISQLVVYSTGGEIQFSDREHIDAIVKKTKQQDYPVRSIIYEIVLSDLFRNK